MNEVYPKFIIEDGQLILGMVSFHRDLVVDKNLVKGGGWFTLNEKAFTLFGKSEEFGTASIEDISEYIKNNKVYWTQFSNDSLLDEGHTFNYNTGSETLNLPHENR